MKYFIRNNSKVWYIIFFHASMDLLKSLSKDELVDNLPNIISLEKIKCVTCQKIGPTKRIIPKIK